MCFSTKRGFRCSFRQIRMSTAFASTCALVGGGLIYARASWPIPSGQARRGSFSSRPRCASTSPPLCWCWTQKPSRSGRPSPWRTSRGGPTSSSSRSPPAGASSPARRSPHPRSSRLAALPVKFADERDAQKTRPRGDESPARTHIHLKRKRHSHPHAARDAGVGFACKLACLSACVRVALPALDANSSTSKPLTLCRNATYAVALYAFLGALFDLGAALASAAFGAPLARHFDLPFLATSFGDFWGARWNLVAGASLRDTVYAPITEGRFFSNEKPSSTTRLSDSRGAEQEQGRRRKSREKKSGAERKARTRSARDAGATSRRVVGVFACFAVSGAMHEFVLWALEGRSSRLGTSRAIGWEWFAFFFAQAPLVSLEAAYAARRRARREKTPEDARRKPPTRARRVFSSERRKTVRFSPRSSRWPTRCSSRPSRATAWTRASWRTCAKRWGWGSFRRFYK